MANEYGIEGLKTGLMTIASMVKATFLIDKNKDGKVDTAEKINYATSLIPAVLGLAPVVTSIGKEAKDLTSEEINELILFIETLDFLPESKDHVENYIRRVVNWINYNRRFVAHSIDFFKQKQEQEKILSAEDRQESEDFKPLVVAIPTKKKEVS